MDCNLTVTGQAEPEIKPNKPHGAKGRSGPPHNMNSLRHGYYTLKKLIRSRQGALDKRTILGRMVIATIQQLTADRGGDPSTAEAMLIRDVAIDTLLLQALENRLDVAPIRKGKIHPVYTLRGMLIAQRREHLKLLGIHRVPKVVSLNELLAQPEKPDTSDNATDTVTSDTVT